MAATKFSNLKEALVLRLGEFTTYITDITADPSVSSHNELDIKLSEIEEFKGKYESYHEKVVDKVKDTTEFNGHQAKYVEFFKQCSDIKLSLIRAYKNVPAGSSSAIPEATQSTSSNSNNAKSTIQLPRIDLPKFNGDYLHWPSFVDLFNSMIQNNSNISAAQKLQYLKSSLEGEPAQIVSSLQVTGCNYAEAWKLLNSRYDNKRAIVNCHLKSLFYQQSLKTESSELLRKLLDTTQQAIRSLHNQKLPTDKWDDILVFLIAERLDPDSRRQWELSLNSNECPTFTQLTTFIESRCLALENIKTINYCKADNSSRNYSTQSQPQSTKKTLLTSTTKPLCQVCNQPHYLTQCSKFNQSSHDEKQAIVKKNNLCYNCLKPNHSSSNCRSGNCRICSKRHHTLLHKKYENDTTSTTNNNAPYSTSVKNHFVKGDLNSQTLLATAQIYVQDASGDLIQCTALLDSGSEASFITEELLQRLGLPRKQAKVTVNGLGSSDITKVRGRTDLYISSMHSNFKWKLNTYVLRRITENLPSDSFTKDHWRYIKGLNLADPDFNQSKSIDVLLGGDVFPSLQINALRRGPFGAPLAQNSALGWILSGPMNQNKNPKKQIIIHHITIDELLQKFWEIEEYSDKRILTNEEKECESHFASNHTRNSNGKFTVHLPFKLSTDSVANGSPSPLCFPLGNSKQAALRRFFLLERRLSREPETKRQYIEFMQEYISLQHMSEIPRQQIQKDDDKVYYIPHHPVIKEASTTTKLRVVFDASAKSKSGYSLNDNLMVGPTIQQDLISILLRFRTHAIAFTADIAKMYRQTLVHEPDQDFQRIIWREDPTHPLKEFRLSTVTYGTASAPYQATKSLQQLAKCEENNYPLASEITLRDFYVDDIMSGERNEKDAILLQQQLLKLMESGGLELRKFSSNSQTLLEAVPPHLREMQLPLNIETDTTVKALGLQWHPAADIFTYKVSLSPLSKVTKRNLLSDVAKLFDPLGLLPPVIVSAKMLLQELWLQQIDWDTEVSSELKDKWLSLRENLSQLQTLKIHRYIGSIHESSSQLHGYCDSSELAYAAAIYLRSTSVSGQVSIHLICSKTKVSPIKRISLPRLELCGALLLSRLFKSVIKSFSFKGDYFAWTDSTIVLAWLSALPNKWTTFVANRVAEIQNTISPSRLFHVRSQDNPADVASRGLSPGQLIASNLWWNGPSWLKENCKWIQEPISTSINPPEAKVKTLHTTKQVEVLPFSKFSSLSKLQNTTAFVIRFIHNLKAAKEVRIHSLISYAESNAALTLLIKIAQQSEFKKEISYLQQKKDIESSSSLLRLSPFLDSNGLLLVGGRLEHSSLNYRQKHPIILPKNHPLTLLIIQFEHKRNLHAGTNLLISILQQRFWIVHAKSTVKSVINTCLICYKHKVQISQQLMANLPSFRTEPARPFYHTGLDFAGPVLIRQGIRGQKATKCYIAIFICMSVKAIHLELVSSLSSEAFIASLRRFAARRGNPGHIYSDNGTNFKGAEAELKTLLKQASTDSSIAEFSNQQGLIWHFNPPASPHFGGLWEAGVKSTKFHLKRILGTTPLNFEEFSTVLAQIESCLNSRPLTPNSTDPNDLTALTPGHFLIGEPPTTLPDPNVLHIPQSRLSRWQLLQSLFQSFWKRWKTEYLQRLQQRPKWTNKSTNFKIGDMILIKDINLPPTKWQLGRIQEVHPGSDGNVRVVTIKTTNGIYKRPSSKLCLLPFN